MADGLDDVSLVIELLLDHPICIRCLVATAAIGASRLELHRATDRCRRCGIIGSVLFVDRSR